MPGIRWSYNTRASVLVAVLVHASIDAFSITLGAIFPAEAVASVFPLMIGFGALAVVLIVLTRGRLGYRPEADAAFADATAVPRVR